MSIHLIRFPVPKFSHFVVCRFGSKESKLISDFPITPEFSRKVREVIEFHTTYGSLPSRRGKTENENSLYNWLVRQKDLKRRGELNVSNENLLQTIPKFELVQPFTRNVALVAKFAEMYGEFPKKSAKVKDMGRLVDTVKESRLAAFLDVVRTKYRRNQLEPERVSALENIPRFSWVDRQTLTVAENLKLLVEFCEKYQDLPKKGSNRPCGDARLNETRLYHFLLHCRHLSRRGGLDPESTVLLNSIPRFRSRLDPMQDFSKNYEPLKSLILAANGDWNVVNAREDKETRLLLSWVRNIRLLKKQNMLSSDLISAMESLPAFKWSSNSATFERNVLELQSFVDKHNRFPYHNPAAHGITDPEQARLELRFYQLLTYWRRSVEKLPQSKMDKLKAAFPTYFDETNRKKVPRKEKISSL